MAVVAASSLHVCLLLVSLLHALHVISSLSDQNLGKAIRYLKEQKPAENFQENPLNKLVRNKTQYKEQLQGTLPQYNFVLDRIPSYQHEGGVVGFLNRLQESSIARGLQVKDIDNLLRPLDNGAGDPSDLQLIRDFLSIPRLREILGPNFRLSDYKTNAELLWGILSNALNSKEVEDDPALYDAIKNSIKHIQETQEDFLVLDEDIFDRLRGIWIKKPHKALLDILLHVMCQYSNDPEKLENLRQVFNKPKDKILGPNFDVHQYSTVGDLFESLLLHALKSDEVKDDYELYDTLKFYLEKINTHEVESPVSDRLMSELDPDVEFLLSALNECTKDDIKKLYIRELLNNPRLKEILGAEFNPSEAATNGALLRAILLQALHSEEVRNSAGLFDAILYFVNKIQLEGDACKPVDQNFYSRFISSRLRYENPNIDTALSALSSYFQDAGKVPPLRDFLNRQTLAHLLGPRFYASAYPSIGDLTQAILDRILASAEIKGNSELYNTILHYVKETHDQDPRANQKRQFVYKLDTLLSALHIKLNETIVAPVRDLLSSPRINDILGPYFDPAEHRSPSDLLQDLLLKVGTSAEVQANPALKSATEIIVDRLRSDNQVYPRIFRNATIVSLSQVGGDPTFNVTAIIRALRSLYDDGAKLKRISTLFKNNTRLHAILGVDYKPKVYNSTILYLQNLLSSILASKDVARNSELKEALTFYLAKIKEEILANTTPDNVYFDILEEPVKPKAEAITKQQESVQSSDPDIEYLLQALENYSKENREKLKQLREFLSMPNVTKLMGSRFSYSKFSNKQVLENILNQALKNKDVKNNTVLFDTLKFYISTLQTENKTPDEVTTYPSVDFLLRALTNQNNSNIIHIHELLRNPDLSNILGPAFNPHQYYTNGELLKAIISHALNSSYVQKSVNLLKALEQVQSEVTIIDEGNWLIGPEFFYKLKDYIQIDSHRISQYPNIEILLRSLAPEARKNTKLSYLFNFLISPELYKILGTDFNPYMYATNGELLQAILNFSLNSDYVQRDTFLFDLLKKILDGVTLHGLGSIPIDAVFFYQLQIKNSLKGELHEEESFDILLSVTKTHVKDNPNLAHLFDFLLNSNKTDILGSRFHYNDYSTNGELLSGILKHAAESQELQNNTELHKAVTFFANNVDLEREGNNTLEKDFYHKLIRKFKETYEVYPNLEYLINALRTSYKQGPEFEQLFKFLTQADLRTAFRPGFNYKKYHTNGELLEAILRYASYGNFEHLLYGLKSDAESKLPLEPEFFLYLQRKEHREYNPYTDYLLDAALGEDAKNHVKRLRQFLSDPELILHLGGLQFDAYSTLGELLRAILRRALHVERVIEDPELFNIVKESLSRILIDGNSSRPSDYGPNDYPVTFDMNALILALDIDAMYRDNLGLVVSKIGDFLRDEFRPLIHLINFPFEVFRTRGEFMRGLFNHLLATGTLSDRSRANLQRSLPYIKTSGLGSEPVDYVPFVIE